MPELAILEARVPSENPIARFEERTAPPSRFSPVASWFNGPVLAERVDICAANMADLLDRAEDPAR